MHSSTQRSQTTEGQSTTAPSVTELLSAWQKVYQSIRLKLRLNASLIAADWQLTLRALVITLVCIVSLVALALTFWITLLTAMCIGLSQLGLHWSISAALVLLLNGAGIVVIQHQLQLALSAVHMQATVDALMPTAQSTKEDGND